MIKTNVRLKEELHRKFKAHCAKTGEKMQNIIANLLEEYMSDKND